MFLTLNEAIHVCSDLAIGKPLSQPMPLSTSYCHHSYFVQTQLGRFILKKSDRWQCFPWIEGEVVSVDDVTINQMEALANLIANLHRDAKTIAVTNKAPRVTVALWQQALQRLCKNNPPLFIVLSKYREEVERLLSLSASYWKVMQTEVRHCHRDILPGNVVWQMQNHPVLIDWEWQGPLIPLAEVMGVLVNWCRRDGQWRVDRVESFLQRYFTWHVQPTASQCQLAFLNLTHFWLEWVIYLMRLKNVDTTHDIVTTLECILMLQNATLNKKGISCCN